MIKMKNDNVVKCRTIRCTYINNMINSSNYEINRNRRNTPISSSDLVIHGLVMYNYAPLKRRIDGKDLFNTAIVGRSYLHYNDDTDTFFTDNKLKVIDIISNRNFNILYLIFHRGDGLILKIKHDLQEKDKFGLCLKTIMNAFLQVCSYTSSNGSCSYNFPKNIFTNDPLVCELFHYLLSKFLMYHHKNIRIFFIIDVKFNIKNIIAKLKKKKFRCKTRVVYAKNTDSITDTVKDLTSNSHQFGKYWFQNQLLVIKDCRIGKFSKIIINILPDHIENGKDYYIIEKKEKNDQYREGKNDLAIGTIVDKEEEEQRITASVKSKREMKKDKCLKKSNVKRNFKAKTKKTRGRKKKEIMGTDFCKRKYAEAISQCLNNYFCSHLMKYK